MTRLYGHARLTILCAFSLVMAGASAVRAEGLSQEGLRLLLETPYLPADFDQETIDRVWQVWPEPLRSEAAAADPSKRRKMTFDRYGLTPRLDDPDKPLQYVVDERGNWTMNCFSCHGGRVAGQVVPGLPNSSFALELLTVETRKLKWKLGKELSRMDVGQLVMPLGINRGTTNAVMFGVALMAYRDADLNVHPQRRPAAMVHHDMDAPPWWHLHKKGYLYIDGFAPKGARALMQFMLVKENGPQKFRRWETDYQHILAYIESLRSPPYPFEIDAELAAEGARLFESHCAECHGTYGAAAEYPERRVEIDELGTDPVRLVALTPYDRAKYQESWFARGQHDAVVLQPEGYVAPPLDGIWATAPYFHNGAVPTLWHVLHPDERPVAWRREGPAGYAYDRQRVGLEIVEERVEPERQWTGDELREVFDTRLPGKSCDGHDYPQQLTEEGKRAVLEYLKTL